MQATGFQLDQAVELFFASGGGTGEADSERTARTLAAAQDMPGPADLAACGEALSSSCRVSIPALPDAAAKLRLPWHAFQT